MSRFTSWAGSLLGLAFALLTAGAGEHRVKTWRTEDGLPHNQITCLAQTADGYLWVGTVNGLARFDGQRFEVYDARNQPPMFTSDVASFLSTRRNGLLFLTRDGQWCQRRDDGTFAARPDLIQMTAWLEDDSGRDWAVRLGQLWEAGPVRSQSVSSELPLSGAPMVASGRRAPAVYRADGWWEWLDGRWQKASGLPAFPGPGYAWTVPRKSGGSWLIQGSQVHLFTPGRSQLQSINRPGVTDNVSTLLGSTGGSAALVTNDGRVYRLDPATGTVEPVNQPDGQPFTDIVAALPDDEGNLWLGTRNDGLIRLSESAFTLRDRRHGLPSAHLTTVALRRAGGLWLGSQEGHVGSLGPGEDLRLRRPHNDVVVQMIHEDPRGGLWMGAQEAGLRFFPGGEGTGVAPSAGPPWSTAEWPAAYLETRRGEVWVAGGKEVFRKSAGGVQTFKGQDDLIEPGGICLAEDKFGRVWVGTYAGISLWEEGRWSTIRYGKDTFPTGVFSLLADDDGGMWIGTKGNRLNRVLDGRLTGFPLDEETTDNAVCGMVKDRAGNLWLATFRGLMRVRPEAYADCVAGRRSHLDADTFGAEDGLPVSGSYGPAQPTIVADDTGMIHCATLQGLVSFDPSRVERTWVPSPRIEEIRLDGRASRLDARSAFEVPAGTSQVEIRFTGIQLSRPGKVRFRYRLEGVDATWKESGLRRSALYPKLPPGRHTFRVQAAGPGGGWQGPEASLDLAVGAFFWETRWFRFSTITAAAAAGILLVRFISTRRLALRLAAAEKLAAVERERVRISRDMHDDLGARLTKIAFFSELAERDIGEGKGSGSFRSVARMSRDAAQALDEMVWAVKPSNDTLAGLTEYICRYATEYLEETELRLRLDLPLNIPVRPLAAEVRHDVYLTIKEALNNVVKHADAQEVTLRLSPGEDGFEVRVVDDGRGFDAGAAEAAGNGLSNMRRRLEQWGGSARITSSPGRGTEVRLWVPLKPLAGH